MVFLFRLLRISSRINWGRKTFGTFCSVLSSFVSGVTATKLLICYAVLLTANAHSKDSGFRYSPKRMLLNDFAVLVGSLHIVFLHHNSFQIICYFI